MTPGRYSTLTLRLMRAKLASSVPANGKKAPLIVSKSIWPGVRKKRAKGKTYWYWTKVQPGAGWVRLPDPYTDVDGFMRKMAFLQRRASKLHEATRSGTFGALGKIGRAACGERGCQ